MRAESAEPCQTRPSDTSRTPEASSRLTVSRQSSTPTSFAASFRCPTAPQRAPFANAPFPCRFWNPFGLGYAPDRWTALTDHLRARGRTDQQLVASGLSLVTRRGTLVDRFRDRLVFPVRNADSGDVIAFIGRTVSGHEGTPRYLNSPQAAIYHKGEHLYGLGDEDVRDRLRHGAQPVLVEGPWDALAVSAVGGDHFVGIGSAGTALTTEQVTVLDCLVPLAERGVVVFYGEDKAGRHASVRVHQLLQTVGAHAYAAPGLPGHDPARLYSECGPDVLRTCLDLAQRHPLAERVLAAHVDRWARYLETVEGRVFAAREAVDVALQADADVFQLLERARSVHGLPVETLITAIYDSRAQQSITDIDPVGVPGLPTAVTCSPNTTPTHPPPLRRAGR